MKLTLRAARINVGYTQENAAKSIGISKQTLSKYERGISFPNTDILKRIGDVYGVTYNDITFLHKNNG